MLEVHLLGRGGMVPLPDRPLTALLARWCDRALLIDCGEGTQVALRKAGLGFKQIGAICLTHFHADHVAGLPGLLLTIGNAGREDPLVIVGPRQVAQLAACLCVIAPQLPFPLEFVEVPDGGGPVLELEGAVLSAQPVEHWVPCFAYRLDLPRQGRFLAEQARALGVPVPQWSLLQRGETVTLADGREVRPGQVLGPPRRGIRLCYATDLRPSPALAAFAREADLFVCEGMYGDPESLDKALAHKHCLFSEAAAMARDAGAGELWLTHFSPSLTDPEACLSHAANLFPATYLDRHRAVLRFLEE